MKHTIIAAAAALIAANTFAQAAGEQSAMPECVGPCTYSHQTIGDTTDTVDNSNSYSKQLNPSSNSNASGVDIEADQRLQQSGNTVDQSGNNLRTGDSNARGNTTTIGPVDNTSDASNYASNVGGAATVGDTTAGASSNHSGDTSADSVNTLTGGNNAAKQQQGIADSGNASQQQANHGTNAQGQAQRSSAAQGQSAEIDASDNSNLSVDASDRSTTHIDATMRYYPPVIHQTPSQLATPAMAVTISECGPVVKKTREEVLGVFHGWIGNNSVMLGWDEDLIPATDADGLPGYYASVTMRDGSVRLFGNQVTTTHAVIGVAGGRSLSLFGAGKSSAGEVGAGGNSSMQRVVLRHTIRVCDAGTYAPAPRQMLPAKHDRG